MTKSKIKTARCTGRFLWLQHGTTPAAVTTNRKMNSFKGRVNIQKKEGGPDRSVSDNQSSVSLNELTMKARKSYCNFKLQHRSHTMTDINQNEVQII